MRIPLLLLVMSLVATVVLADVCPACKGTGRVGCGRCFWPFIGKCNTCSGLYATRAPGPGCPSCRGSGICPGCNGQGMTCLACNGTGRLPAGTLAKRAAEQRQQNLEAIRHALQPLAFMDGGTWALRHTKGTDIVTGTYSVRSCLEGTWLLFQEASRYPDGRADDCLIALTYEPDAKGYFMLEFAGSGQAVVLRGPAGGDGRTLALAVVGQESLRLVWKILPGTGLDMSIEQQSSGGWNRLSESRVRQGAASPPAGSGVPPAAAGAVKSGLRAAAFLAGQWETQGQENNVAVTGEISVEPLFGGTWYRMTESSHYADGRTLEGEVFLTWVPDLQQYRLIVLTVPGQSTDLRGRSVDGGRGIDFRPVDQEDAFRLLWQFRPQEGLDVRAEMAGEQGWTPYAVSSVRRGGQNH
ncbi:MAG: hypothetical protein MUE60_08155 [Candidatus Eisenbacteria bacterium]|nr:hypothetical protein [Candidatus Eisenbacteria bacterium]